MKQLRRESGRGGGTFKINLEIIPGNFKFKIFLFFFIDFLKIISIFFRTKPNENVII